MKKILPLLFFLSVFTIKAQITVSGTCDFNPSPIGNYSNGAGAIFNGRNVYTIDGLPDCGDNITASSCASGGGFGISRYRILWTGSQWILEGVSCFWDSLLEACTTSDYGNGTVIAYNNADTSLPPNGDWVSNFSSCNFTISGGSLGLDDINKGNPIMSIHPNPAVDEITIDFIEPITNASLKILDIKGQTILSTTLQNTTGETIKLNQPAGLYFLTLMLSDGKQYNYKLIKN